MNKVELFRNLVVMAVADGKVTEDEKEFLAVRAVQWGITEEDAVEAIDNATAKDIEFTVPATKAQCYELLKELVRMMAIDGELAPVERGLCAAAAMAMNIGPQEFKEIVDSMM